MMYNDLLGFVVKYVLVQFLWGKKNKKKNMCFDQNLLGFVSLYHCDLA